MASKVFPDGLTAQQRWRLNNPEKNAEFQRQWREKNPDYNKNYIREKRKKDPEQFALWDRRKRLKLRYGITIEQYEEMVASQNGCAVCGHYSENGSRLVVDHDHVTGKVRGLLCHNCNLTLGKFEDNISWIKNLAAYLGHHQTANVALS